MVGPEQLADLRRSKLTALVRAHWPEIADQAHRMSMDNARTLLAERRRAGKALLGAEVTRHSGARRDRGIV